MSDFTGALTMDDKEQQHLMAALRQPLFIQTPLQAMLEHVLQKMQKHSQIISDAWDKVGGRLWRVCLQWGDAMHLAVHGVYAWYFIMIVQVNVTPAR